VSFLSPHTSGDIDGARMKSLVFWTMFTKMARIIIAYSLLSSVKEAKPLSLLMVSRDSQPVYIKKNMKNVTHSLVSLLLYFIETKEHSADF
jgi:hypothetical protein